MIELTYIEATGTQFINTGIAGNIFTRIVLEVLPASTALTENAYICSTWSVQGPLLISFQNKWRWHAGSSVDDGAISTSEYSVIDMDTTGFSVNNTRYNFPGSGNRTANNIMLFQRVGGTSGANGAGRVKSLKIYGPNSVLLLDLTPARDDNNVVCMYDRVTGTYFYNTGTGDFIGGDPAQPSYTVAYNANGGTGTMSNQVIFVDVPTSLTLNAFTREDHVFAGWATSSDGEVVYENGATVLNLAEADQTITLYAVWDRSPLVILLQTNTSEPNKVDKDLYTIATVTGTLRSGCSLQDPVLMFELELEDFAAVNYITIPRFGRSYFVQDVTSVNMGLLEMTCHVDVLSSFKDQIRANTAIIKKQEGEWNLYLNDGSLRIYQNPVVLTKPFPSGFSTYEYIMAIAGT